MEIDFISALHNKTKRDYLARVNDPEYPKHLAAEKAKKFEFDYWDGDRRICYGGYRYIPGRWTNVAKKLIEHYELSIDSKVLDVGCGKGYLLFEIMKLIPGITIRGIDISNYAIKYCKEEIKDFLKVGNATDLPFENNTFDLVLSINTLHTLYSYELEDSLKEINRVSKKDKYICVESYTNELQKANLLYWQVTCEAFNTPKEWEWWFNHTGYDGDYSYIYFD